MRVSTRFSLSVENEQADSGTGRVTKFSGASGDSGNNINPVQLTTSRIGNLLPDRSMLYSK